MGASENNLPVYEWALKPFKSPIHRYLQALARGPRGHNICGIEIPSFLAPTPEVQWAHTILWIVSTLQSNPICCGGCLDLTLTRPSLSFAFSSVVYSRLWETQGAEPSDHRMKMLCKTEDGWTFNIQFADVNGIKFGQGPPAI